MIRTCFCRLFRQGYELKEVKKTPIAPALAGGIEMAYNPDIHHRRSIRLQGYDYSRAGAYFITICTQNREMVLNHAGTMIQTVWNEIPFHYTGTEIDEFVVMPNLIHGIVVIGAVGAGPRACPGPVQPRGK
jgi:putative transposase